MSVTRRQAEAVLRLVKKRHHTYVETGKDLGYTEPALLENWHWGSSCSHPAPWAIVWEEGPYEWAHRFVAGGIDPEMAVLAAEFNAKPREEEPAKLPPGVHVEPIFSYAIGLWPE